MTVVRLQMDDRIRALTLYWACVLLALLLALDLVLFVQFKNAINNGIEAAARAGGSDGIVSETLYEQMWAPIWIGVAMSVPYFLFGVIITLIFKTSPAGMFHSLYFADLVGASLGCVLAIASLEWGGYAFTALLPCVVALLAGSAYLRGHVTPRAAIAATVLALSPMLLLLPQARSMIEPAPQLNMLARDFRMEQRVSELWHGWNSYSRVGALRAIDEQGKVGDVMALGNGEGHAHLVAYKEEGYGDWKQNMAVLGMALGAPKTALVLFAGTGSDMLALDYYAGGKTSITGVELNHTMIRGALELKEYNLDAFYRRPTIRMAVSEAREFLEQDKARYDVILLSWSGATVAYYSGSIGHTTQFVYTREAFEALLDHLEPNGFIVVGNTNKVNSLATFRSIMEERGRHDAGNSALILYVPGAEGSRWDRYWDENPLIFKPSGLSAEEVRRFAEAGREIGMEVAYDPNGARPEFEPYGRMMNAPDLHEALRDLNRQNDLRFSIVTDDRPFSLDLFRFERYLEAGFWSQMWDRTGLKSREAYRVQQTLFVLATVAGALVLLLGPLLIRSGPPRSRMTLQHLVYFSVLGGGFMLIEIALVHKMGLLLGNPAFAIAVVLAGIILSTGVGSLFSKAAFDRGATFQSCVLFIAAYAVGFVILSGTIVPFALGWPLGWRIVLTLAIIAPLGFVMGQLFPQGLVEVSRHDNSYLPWAWAINGTIGTIAAGFAPLLAQALGFRALLLAGAAIYLSVLLLPNYARRRAPRPAVAS
jgi:spermidine synthase